VALTVLLLVWKLRVAGPVPFAVRLIEVALRPTVGILVVWGVIEVVRPTVPEKL
jgi:hypothetical protein